MRRRLLGVLLVGGILSLLAGVAGPAWTAQAAPEQVYLALGDSIAAGLVTSLPRDRGYPWLVRNLIETENRASGNDAPVTLDNLAVPGETVTSFLNGEQLQRAISEIQAIRARGADLRAVTVTLGGNDLLRLAQVSDAQRQAGLDAFTRDYPAALAAIKDALGELKPDIVVTTYYDLSEGDPAQQGSDSWWLARFNQVIRQSAAQVGAKVADLEADFRGHIQEWTWHPSDVHPNNAGHAEIARLVWQALGYDSAPPTVTIERPAAGTLERRTPTIRAKVGDDVGVTSVQLLVDGKAVSDLIYVPSQGAYLGVWDARDVAENAATLAVRASDLAGHQTTAEVRVTLPGS